MSCQKVVHEGATCKTYACASRREAVDARGDGGSDG